MKHINNKQIKPLITSKEGLHVSAYIKNTGHILDLKRSVRECLRTAHAHLKPVLTKEERTRFLSPIEKLVDEYKLLQGFKGNIAIFRAENTFRLMSVPTPVDTMCVVATTFHVKPLLRWLQAEKDFLLLGFEEGMASLYRGTMGSLQFVDSIIYPKVIHFSESQSKQTDWSWAKAQKESLGEVKSWLESWCDHFKHKEMPKLYLAGDIKLTEHFMNRMSSSGRAVECLNTNFNKKLASSLAVRVRQLMQSEVEFDLRLSLMEYDIAEEKRQGLKNIFLISRSAVKGRIKKLIIAEDVNVFGKMCQETGSLKLHPAGLDHEDDCILDDLAQKVLMSGGEVLVTSRENMPNRRPALAILNKKEPTKALELSMGPLQVEVS